MPSSLPAPIPAVVNPAPDPTGDYVTRAELSAFLTKGATAVVVGVFAKSAASDSLPQRILGLAGAAKPTENRTLNVLDRVIDSIENGTDLAPTFGEIARLIHAQDQRAEIISQLALTQDYRRLTRAMRAQEKLEESLFTAALNDELLPAERILVMEKLEGIISTTRKAIGAQSTSVNDIMAMLEKLDYTAELAGAGMRASMKGTTAQGRELVRKLLTSVNKKVREVTDV